MLRKKQKNLIDNYPVNSVLGTDVYLKGEITYQGVLRIDGRIDGKISGEGKIIIGDNAFINADIISNIVIIGGTVIGNIIASEKLEVLSKGKVEGKVITKSLIIAEGAILKGECTINSENITKNISEEEQEQNIPTINIKEKLGL